MKTLRKTDIESMEKELQILGNPKMILGGTGAPPSGSIDGGTLPEVIISGKMQPGIQLTGMSYADISAFLDSLKTSFIDSVINEGFSFPSSGMIADCYNNMKVECLKQLWTTGYSGVMYFSVRDLTPSSASPTYDMRIYAEDGTRIAYSNNCGGDYWPF